MYTCMYIHVYVCVGHEAKKEIIEKEEILREKSKNRVI